MDKNTVFTKTKEGEEAVRQRTRIVQRNLRNILIMVDGHASVADLVKRFGDENAAMAALAELQAGGFIVVEANPLDFTTTPARDAGGEGSEDVPLLTTPVAAPPARDLSPGPQSPARPAQPSAIEEIELPALDEESLPPSGPVRRGPQPVAAGPGWMERIKAALAGAGRAAAAVKARKAGRKDSDEAQEAGPAELMPVRRGGRKLYLSWPLLALFAIAAIAVLPALTLLLYPYGRHLPEIERKASAMLQDPVKIGDIGFSFLPRPHVALRNITAGKDAHLSIASARAVPDFLSLLGGRQIFHELAFDKATVKDSGLGRLARIGAGDATVEIRHITITDMSLATGDALIGGIGGEVKMSAAGTPEKILLNIADGRLRLEMQPKGEAYLVAATGSDWKALSRPDLTFQWLDAKGELRPSRLELTRIEGKVFDGQIEGKATLDWADKAAFSGDFEIKRANPARLLSALGSDLSAEGELTASLRIEARADSPGKLAASSHVAGAFEVKRGAAKGFDLAEAVRARAPTHGGETKFEQLSGSLQYDSQECRLGNLRLGSGLLKAGGSLVIAGNGRLSGVMDVELKSSAMTLRMPLAVGGTTKEPLLTPTRAR